MLVLILSLLLVPFLSAAEDCAIHGVRLSLGAYYSDLTASPNSSSLLRITFHTNDQCNGMNVSTQKYNSTESASSVLVQAIEQFNITDNSGASLNIISIYIHTFDVIGSYDFETRYNYSISNSSASRQFYFHLPRRDVDSTMNPINVLFTGMMDNSSSSYYSIKNLTAWATDQQKPRIDCLIYLGDMAFKLDDNLYQKGINFFKEIESFTAYIPFMPTPGTRDSASNFEFYSKMISSPQGQDFHYSFNLGYVHFVQVNLESYFNPGSDEMKSDIYNWLADDLSTAYRRVNRLQRPWIIVYGYQSFYCSNTTDPFCGTHTGSAADVINIENLFRKYSVDLYFSSSYLPVYERLNPIYNKVIYTFGSLLSYDTQYQYMVNPEATIYLIEAAAGNALFYEDSTSAFHSYDKGFYSLRADPWTGIGVMTVRSGTQLDFNHTSMEDDVTDRIIDTFTLINTLQKYGDDWPYTDKVTFISASIVFTIIGGIFLILFMLKLE